MRTAVPGGRLQYVAHIACILISHRVDLSLKRSLSQNLCDAECSYLMTCTKEGQTLICEAPSERRGNAMAPEPQAPRASAARVAYHMKQLQKMVARSGDSAFLQLVWATDALQS